MTNLARTLRQVKANNIWVTCQTDDDLPYVLKYAGEDNIVVGTDYGHQDQSSEIEAMRVMREKGEVDPRVIDKIMGRVPVLTAGNQRLNYKLVASVLTNREKELLPTS